MVTLQEVERQLEALGANNRYWGRAEIVELQHILVPGEHIHASMNGRYEGGFATFVVTDQRLLLVDKKPFYLTVEDMRYDMISEVDFGAQLLSGTIKICTPTKTLSFTTMRPQALRKVAMHIQQIVMQIRRQPSMQTTATQAPAVPASAAAPTPAVYASMLGEQAINGSEAQRLPLPERHNPYINPPFMMRRRIGRFGSIGASQSKAPVN